MTAINQDFTMYAGDTKDIVVSVTSSGSAKNLTGASAAWRMARSVDAAAVLEKTTGAGIVLSDPAGGELTISLVSSDTQDLVGRFYHECEVTDGDGDVATILVGDILIRPTLI